MSDIAGLTLRERVEDRILLAGRRVGDEGIAGALPVNSEGDRVYVGLRDDIQTGGSLALMIRADAYDKDAERLDEMIRRTLRARARLRAVGGIEDADHHAPEWSFTVHRVIDAALRGAGADPLWTTPMHRNTGGQRMLDMALEDSLVAVSDVRTEAGRITTDVMRIEGDPRMLLWENREGCGVRIFAQLPSTLVHALAGLRLGDAIDHPLLAAASGVRIRAAWTDDPGGPATVIHLEDDPVPVRPAPAGTDLRWLGMPY